MKLLIAGIILSFSLPMFAETKLTNIESSSVIKWTGEKIVGAKHHGIIKIKEGHLNLVEGFPASGEFLIDMDSIFVQDLEVGSKMHEKLMKHLRSKDFFRIKKHPYAKLTILSVKKLKKSNKIEVNSELEIKGVSKPLVFTAEYEKNGKSYTAQANFVVDRKVWGLKYGSNWATKKLDKIIKDQIGFGLKIKMVKL